MASLLPIPEASLGKPDRLRWRPLCLFVERLQCQEDLPPTALLREKDSVGDVGSVHSDLVDGFLKMSCSGEPFSSNLAHPCGDLSRVLIAYAGDEIADRPLPRPRLVVTPSPLYRSLPGRGFSALAFLVTSLGNLGRVPEWSVGGELFEGDRGGY